MRKLMLGAFLLVGVTMPLRAEWKPGPAPILTQWAKNVDPARPLPEYPRPQMVRADWQNLNGLWNYAIRPRAETQPSAWDGQILVPFAVESALSGVMKTVGPEQRLWYQRKFTMPPAWANRNVMLHFGACDWETTVWLNGKKLGAHQGGYDPFSFDLSEALQPGGEQELVVAVWDPSNAGPQPRGKQVQKPGGIWYTPTTGIWQTVWLEPVPKSSIRRLHIVPNLDNNAVTVQPEILGPTEGALVRVVATVPGGGFADATGPAGSVLKIALPPAAVKGNLWTPDTPTLWPLKIMLQRGPNTLDTVESYFGMRKLSVGKDAKGVTRLLLNDKFVFQFGPLDQGFWPDGLYTAPTDEALRFDVATTRQLGFNMARKHVKVEPDRWYYWCDKLGLMVWQDMPSGEASVRPGQGEIQRKAASSEIFETELKAMIDARRNHPSIVLWVPFNEGWGQYDTVRITEWVKKYDPSRLVICASGWNDFPVGDAHDIHAYPGPGSPRPEDKRAAVLGEFGGLGLPVKGHTWQSEKNWGYRSFTTSEALTQAYLELLDRLHPLIESPGLSAAVYTQTTDVEVEVNGLLTYDRAIFKMPKDVIAKANKRMYLPPPTPVVLVPTSQEQGQTWKYTLKDPGANWHQPGFDDASWSSGPGGFGTAGTPGAAVRTEWKTPDIWLRRTVELPEKIPGNLKLMIHHDEDAEIYVNGILAGKTQGHVSDYFSMRMSPEAQAALKPGKNSLAVHCKQTRGGQYIDVGFVTWKEAAPK